VQHDRIIIQEKETVIQCAESYVNLYYTDTRRMFLYHVFKRLLFLNAFSTFQYFFLEFFLRPRIRPCPMCLAENVERLTQHAGRVGMTYSGCRSVSRSVSRLMLVALAHHVSQTRQPTIQPGVYLVIVHCCRCCCCCVQLAPSSYIVSAQPCRLSRSGTFRTPLLFSGLRLFVCFVRGGAGRM